MVYKNNFVATIKVNGKILRESKETVAVPFGSEYSIYLKNLSTVRAIVRISVDGQDATEGVWLIAEANSPLELERFIRNGNRDKGNRFKFIQRTDQIEEHRGIGAEDGIIRVEYKFETTPIVYTPYIPYNKHNYDPYPSYWDVTCGGISGDLNDTVPYNNGFSKSVVSSAYKVPESTRSITRSVLNKSVSINDAGITVAGSESNQRFIQGSRFPTEASSHTIILRLVGKVGDSPVTEAVTVQHKPTCTTCGKVNKATHLFCGRCGTSLVLL
jgi:hypothetical protein